MDKQETSPEKETIETKLTWSTPDLEIYSMTDKTQAGSFGSGDGSIFS
ncbi:MAG: hypothetical protein ACK4LB_10960 [Spirosomataceae bacterium]